jgi:competence protein ComFC
MGADLWWKKAAGRLLDLLYPPPPSCGLCGRNIAAGFRERTSVSLCPACAKFCFLSGSICRVCGRLWTEGDVCGDYARRQDTFFVFSRSAVAYNHAMKEYMARYKYRGDRKLAGMMAGFLPQVWKRYYAGEQIDWITYIPLHAERLQERTFNQAEEMARLLGSVVGVPVAGLLVRKRATEKQSRRTRYGRLHAMENVFSYCPEAGWEVPDSSAPCRIVIVDDVYTTGSTLNEAAHALKAGLPGADVYGLTVAR